MEESEYKGFTPDYIDALLPSQVFVFGSNALGYHTGGASRTARKLFGAVWGQAEGLQGQSYAIPVDFGKGVRKDTEVKAAVDRFIDFAKEHTELFFFVTRVGCGIAGYHDEEMAQFFKDALELKNVCLPKSFVDALGKGEVIFDLERFIGAQKLDYDIALNEIRKGQKRGHWIWYIFPQIKGLGHSYNSEYYGLSGKDEAKAYLNNPVLGLRLKEITNALLNCKNSSVDDILGFPDNLKVRSCMTLFEKSQNAIKISRLSIAKDGTVLLTDYRKEIKMEPIVKATYLLFLKHPEGITFKCLPDYRQELADIYQKIKPFGLTERAIRSIEDVTNPLLNSINEKCSRIRAAFQAEVDASLLDQYIIIFTSLVGRNCLVAELEMANFATKLNFCDYEGF